MRRPIKNETGKHHGRLLVLGFDGIINNFAMWLCECECGNKITVRGASLRNKNTQSCGCLQKEQGAKMGSGNHMWKGGVYLDSKGYVLVLDRTGDLKHLHRIIVKQVLGRKLKRNEMVHHINGIKNDNRNDNLLICDNSYHRYLHEKMSRLYQQEHFG